MAIGSRLLAASLPPPRARVETRLPAAGTGIGRVEMPTNASCPATSGLARTAAGKSARISLVHGTSPLAPGAAGRFNFELAPPEPLLYFEPTPVRHLLCFFNERVDLELDDVVGERPRTQSSREPDGPGGGQALRGLMARDD